MYFKNYDFTYGYKPITYKDEDGYYKVTFKFLGYEKDDVHVFVSDDTLTVKTDQDKLTYDISHLDLSDNTKDHIKKMKGGLLEVHLKKNKKREAQEIK